MPDYEVVAEPERLGIDRGIDSTRDPSLLKSKQRVADHGEVFTPAWIVEAMLDLVKGETERIGSRFLAPADAVDPQGDRPRGYSELGTHFSRRSSTPS